MITDLLKEVIIRHQLYKTKVIESMTLEQKRQLMFDILKEEKEKGITPLTNDYLNIMSKQSLAA